jgi:hypothetical protein
MPKLRKLDKDTRPPDPTLRRLLGEFLTEPTDPDRVCDWYAALGGQCPFWALQHMRYFEDQVIDLSGWLPARLSEDLPLELMFQPSRDRSALRKFMRLRPPAAVFRKGQSGWSLGPPPDTVMRSRTLKRFAARYLFQTYRFAVMSNSPGHERLSALWREIDRVQRDYEDVPPESLHFLSPPADYPVFGLAGFAEELRELVLARDLLPPGVARRDAQNRIERFLKRARVLRDRGHKASVPSARRFVKSLAEEACKWLAVVEACRSLQPSKAAAGKLASWGCADSTTWGWRLALPFLTGRELAYVRTGRPERREVTAVYLIHARLRNILALGTVADHAFGAQFVRNNPVPLRANPLRAR